MGNIKRNLKAYNEAHDYYNRALSTCLESNIPFGVMLSRLNIAVTHMEQKKEDDALKQLLEALPIAREVDPVYGASSILNNIADVYFIKKDYNTALQYASECLALAKGAQILEELLDVYTLLADIHEAKGNHPLAMEYLRHYHVVRDSVASKERQDKIAELSARYESEKRESELQLNAQEIELLNRENKIKTLTNSLLIISLTAVILSALVYFLYQRTQKRKLTKDVHLKNQLLSMHALQMIQKNGILETIKHHVAEVADKSGDHGKVFSKIRSQVDSGLSQDKDWEDFVNIFSQVHVDFLSKLRKENADMTTGEIRLAALLRLNLATKEIASILGISPASANIARYRLRKKLNLTREEDLVDFLTKFG
jgi:DNA-binding CsgD family transcriptional regulator